MNVYLHFAYYKVIIDYILLFRTILPIKEYHSYKADSGKDKKSFLRRLFTFILQSFLLLVLLIFALLLVFRWVPIPTSAFIYKQNSLAQQSPKIYAKAVYSWIPWEDIPPQVALAVIAAEDQRFPNHWGVDTVELRKALSSKNAKNGRPRGASTITQQTAKNLFLWNQRSYTRKIVEAGLSLAIEIAWPKKRILEVYLNIAQFGDAIFGIKEASRLLFNKQAKDLSIEEAAMLAAVLPKPAIANVNDPGPNLLQRQKWILKQMKQLGGINYLKKL
jgi:monofunctional biosynthetic peptidoglycan transglycosylase